MSSYCVSNLPCLLHLVRARPCPGKWDSFLVAQGRKRTCPPAEGAIAQVTHCLSGNCLIRQPFIEHLLCARRSLGHFIALDICLLLRSSQQLYSLGCGGGHGPVRWVKELTLRAVMRVTQSPKIVKFKCRSSGSKPTCFLFHHVRLSLSTLGPCPSLETAHLHSAPSSCCSY